MNEKNVFIVCSICFLLLSLSSCCTRAAVYGDGDGAYTVREHIAELGDEQTKSAIASERLNGTLESAREKSKSLSGELTGSREHSERLTQSITDGARELEEIAGILQQIRTRGGTANSATAGNNQ